MQGFDAGLYEQSNPPLPLPMPSLDGSEGALTAPSVGVGVGVGVGDGGMHMQGININMNGLGVPEADGSLAMSADDLGLPAGPITDGPVGVGVVGGVGVSMSSMSVGGFAMDTTDGDGPLNFSAPSFNSAAAGDSLLSSSLRSHSPLPSSDGY